MTYSEKLKDPRWQKKRLEIFNRDNWTCLKCGSSTKTLVVHHLKYKSDPWEIEDEFLKTLCEDCHNESHDDASIELLKNELLEEIQGFKLITIKVLIALIRKLKEYHPEKYETSIFAIWACIFHDKEFFNKLVYHYNSNKNEWKDIKIDRGFEV
jgi:hypothetical protein